MNTNPAAKVVLCFGDSNTWGSRPGVGDGGRFPADVRWTGQLQNQLGGDYYVIEEGRGGRTVNLDDDRPGRNGLEYFDPCIASHDPLDVVIIMLGTNDQKISFDTTAEQIAEGLKQYVDVVEQRAPDAAIILVSPVHTVAGHPHFDEVSVQKSLDQARHIQKVAHDL